MTKRSQLALTELLARRKSLQEYALPLTSDGIPPSDALVIEAELWPTAPWIPSKLLVPTVVDCNYEILSLSAGQLGPAKVAGNGAVVEYAILEPRRHEHSEKIVVRVRRRQPTVIVGWRSVVVGLAAEEKAP